jgi:hypothetical protein
VGAATVVAMVCDCKGRSGETRNRRWKMKDE